MLKTFAMISLMSFEIWSAGDIAKVEEALSSKSRDSASIQRVDAGVAMGAADRQSKD